MEDAEPAAGSPDRRARLRDQLAHAERRLADARSKLLNVSTFSDGNSWGAIDARRSATELNAKISEGQDIERLDADVARLRRRLADDPGSAPGVEPG